MLLLRDFGNKSSCDDQVYNFLDFWIVILQNKTFIIHRMLIIISEIKKKSVKTKKIKKNIKMLSLVIRLGAEHIVVNEP